MKIDTTSDYSVFNTMPGNRPVNKYHLLQLERSILAKNMLQENPILVNENMEVVDGQHRLEVAKQNGLSVYYIKQPNLVLRDVQRLNTYQRRWSVQDFLLSYLNGENESYKTVYRISKKYNVSISTAMNFLGKHKFFGRNLEDFKSGVFTITEKKLNHTIEIFEVCKKLHGHIDNSLLTSRIFIYALEKCLSINKFSIDRLIKKISLCPIKLSRQASGKDYLRLLEDIYNYNQKKETLRFF